MKFFEDEINMLHTCQFGHVIWKSLTWHSDIPGFESGVSHPLTALP